MTSSLLSIFNERGHSAPIKAITNRYTADDVFYEPDAIIEDHEVLSQHTQTPLDT
jgi:hypothetical protein